MRFWKCKNACTLISFQRLFSSIFFSILLSSVVISILLGKVERNQLICEALKVADVLFSLPIFCIMSYSLYFHLCAPDER